ncbi:MAG: hypothetical protein IPJ87_09230 [Flavobacteriales bacterium]|nr:hypothetical protein [Flavobacteriales bacterium]MBK7942043.1 hypothetical protein [Flavobacteriales bacterium]MBK9700588.1 hypothetical protein [Flavobacteriales bacterium]
MLPSFFVPAEFTEPDWNEPDVPVQVMVVCDHPNAAEQVAATASKACFHPVRRVRPVGLAF